MADTVTRYASTTGQTITATFQVAPLTAPAPTVAYYSDAGLTTLVSGPTAMTQVSALVWTAPVPNLTARTLYIDYAYKTDVAGATLHNSDDVLVLVAADVLSSDALATLDEFKAHLNWKAGGTTSDAELQRFLNAATPVIEHITGPVLPRAVIETHSGGRPLVVLRERPVMSVASVTEYLDSTPFVLAQASNPAGCSAYSYTFDPETGSLTRRFSGGGVGNFAGGTDNIYVTYTAGRSTVPYNVKQAALVQAGHMFQKSQLGGRPKLMPPGPDAYASGWGYGVPNEVREYLQASRRLPGLA